MAYNKKTCKMCKGAGCEKCNGFGYLMIAERRQETKLINNKPNGGQTPDMDSRSFV